MRFLNHIYYIFFLLFFLPSCISDYEIEKILSTPEDCIGVNAILNPVNLIQISFFRLEKEGNKYKSIGLENAHVLLKEGETILYDGVCKDSILTLERYPSVGKTYFIEVSYGTMKTVKAKTTVPQAIKSKAFVEIVENSWGWNPNYLVRLTSFEMEQVCQTSLWITSHEIYQDNELSQFREIYCNSILADKENSDNSSNGAINKWAGTIYYEYFLRVKSKNVDLLDEITFTPYAVSGHSESPKYFLVKLISASAEYDQYCKMLYRQKLTMDDDDAISMMIYQPQAVYCNIENGLGIFAAIAEENYYFDTEQI